MRQLAARLVELAAAVRTQTRTVADSVPAGWRGDASRAASGAAGSASDRAEALASGLEQLAGELMSYASQLEAAAHQHAHWWKRVAIVGAVVTVTAAAVVVTVASGGTAAPGAALAEAAAIDAAAGGLAAATSSAAAADTALLTGGARVLAALRPLAAFVRPQLATAEVFAGIDASSRELLGGHIDLASVAMGFGVDLVIPGGVAKLAALPLVVRVGPLAPHLAVGIGLAGGEATRELVVHGSVDPLSVGATGVLGTGTAAVASRVQGRERSLLKVTRGVVARGTLPAVPLEDEVVRLGWTPDQGVTYRVDPQHVRFSQRTTKDPAKNVVELSVGWDGAPIDVVLRADGRLTSIDNKRIIAAEENNVQLQVRVHTVDESIPLDRAEKIVNKKTKEVPTTWGEALDNRIGDQSAYWRVPNPDGSYFRPTIGGPKPK